MRLKNGLMLMLTSFIWGTAFVAQSVGMEHLGPFSFNGVRNFVGCATLLPCIWILGKINAGETGESAENADQKEKRKDLVKGGIACGILLFAAGSLQQIGLQYTSVGKTGFITSGYIVIVPILGIFLHRKVGWKVWTAVVFALAGLYFLCITEKFSIGKGDIVLFLCAFVFSLHIIVIDHFSPKVDGVKLSCVQFFVCGVLSLAPMLIFETPSFDLILKSWAPILYAGVLSSGVAYTLQIVAQKEVKPAVASLILSLESCFSVLAGWIVLKQHLSAREALGCVLMFTAIILAQVPDRKKEEERIEVEVKQEQA